MKKNAGRRLAYECFAGILVLFATLVPNLVFREYLSWTTYEPLLSVAKIVHMALTAFFGGASLYYFAGRICRYLDDDNRQ